MAARPGAVHPRRRRARGAVRRTPDGERSLPPISGEGARPGARSGDGGSVTARPGARSGDGGSVTARPGARGGDGGSRGARLRRATRAPRTPPAGAVAPVPANWHTRSSRQTHRPAPRVTNTPPTDPPPLDVVEQPMTNPRSHRRRYALAAALALPAAAGPALAQTPARR